MVVVVGIKITGQKTVGEKGGKEAREEYRGVKGKG